MTVENYKIIDKKWVTHKMRNLQHIYNQFMQGVTAELKVVWWQGLPSISYSGKLRNVLIENTWYKQKNGNINDWMLTTNYKTRPIVFAHALSGDDTWSALYISKVLVEWREYKQDMNLPGQCL